VKSDRAATPDDGLGLFTCADTVGQSQLNAWGSWKRVPDCSVSIFGDAPGIGEHARRFGFRSLPTVKRDEFGRPLLNWIFECMHEESTESVLGYINSDIVLLPGLAACIAAVRAQFDAYLIVARRWNVESVPDLDFESGWDEKLRHLVAVDGDLFTPYGIDLFVFSRGLLREIPPFALGSDYWDNYLLMQTRRRGYPVVDVTRQVMLVHQNHALGKYRSAAERRRSPEGLRAFALAGDSHAMLGATTDATHVIERGELQRTDTAHVTVSLAHRGDTRRLCRCLRSLEYQTYPRSFLDTIVVNTDAHAPLRYLEADFPAVRVVTATGAGPSAARNKGISCATAEVVALFESDTVPATECLRRAMRVMKEQPECRVVACRIKPHFSSGRPSYMGRAVEWFDVVAHYNPEDWTTDAGAHLTGALIVRKEVFAECGYFSELCREAAGEDWARRVLAAGVKVAFCRDAVVLRETVASMAELRRRRRRQARGECILEALDRDTAYGVKDIFRDEWRALRAHVRSAWTHQRLPPRFRAGVLWVSLRSFVWTLGAKLRYRTEAQRFVRRRRRALARRAQPGAGAEIRPRRLPLRRLGAVATARSRNARRPVALSDESV